MASTPTLAFLDFSKQFIVETVASRVGIRAVLSQGGHPIAYLSKAISGPNLALSTYDKEMLAIVFAVQHWRVYLLGQQLWIITDHKPIKYFLEQRITTPQQQKWLVKLLGYNYSVKYWPISQNAVPDALSRKEELLNLWDFLPLFWLHPYIKAILWNRPPGHGYLVNIASISRHNYPRILHC